MRTNFKYAKRLLSFGLIVNFTIILLANDNVKFHDENDCIPIIEDTVFILQIDKIYNNCFEGKTSEEIILSLEPIVKFITSSKLLHCEIGCYNNCLVDDSLMKEILTKRGELIFSSLVERGINPNQISLIYNGSGDSFAIQSDTTFFSSNTIFNCDSIRLQDINYKNPEKMSNKTKEAYRLMKRFEIKVVHQVD